jgi:hypothetical protein
MVAFWGSGLCIMAAIAVAGDGLTVSARKVCEPTRMGIASQTQLPKGWLSRRRLINPSLPNAGEVDEAK